MFVTSQGHAYSRLQRALLSKNVNLIDAAARELRQVNLDDALRILVVLAEKRDAHFERAAARFAARVTTERRLSLAEARYVLALAEATAPIPRPDRATAARLLRALTIVGRAPMPRRRRAMARLASKAGLGN